MRVAFTGHRPEQLNIRRNELSKPGQALQDLIWREVSIQEKAGADTFLCGAARGADIICGEIILAEKQTTAPHLNILLQKTFISDHLTKKKKVNRGELPQYYVEGSHECCPYVNTNAPP